MCQQHFPIVSHFHLQINSLHKQNKIPVLVGGTHYYIEAILWKLLVGADVISQEKFLFDHDQEIKRNDQSSEPLTESEEGLNPETIMQKPIIMSSFPNISSESLHKVLATLDPEVADITHPKDKRKVIRALQIIQRHGQKYSQILDDQRSDQISDSHKLIPLRYKNVVVFWTQSDSTILDKRLDDRVDAMKNAGLLEELQDFHERYKVGREKRGFKPDYTEGIFQAIGFKEFHDYLILPEERRLGRLDLQKEGLWQMKIATKQYARKQIKFIRSRFVSCLERDLPPVFAVDTSYPDKWNEDVRDRAFRVMESLLTTGTFPSDIQPIERPSLTDSEKVTQERKLVHHCEICNVTVQGDKTWQLHCNGKGHQSLLKKLKAETAETQQEREGDARSDNPNQSPPTKIEINQS